MLTETGFQINKATNLWQKRIIFTNRTYTITLFGCVIILLADNLRYLFRGWLFALFPTALLLSILIAGIAKHRWLITLTRIWSVLLTIGGVIGLLRGLLVFLAFVLDPDGHTDTLISSRNLILSGALTAAGLYFFQYSKSMIITVRSRATINERDNSISEQKSAGV